MNSVALLFPFVIADKNGGIVKRKEGKAVDEMLVTGLAPSPSMQEGGKRKK